MIEFIICSMAIDTDKILEKLKKICEEYQNDDKYVYKSCNNDLAKKGKKTRKWLVIMKKCDDTITNEDRKDLIDRSCAKFRANKLKVVKIINKKKPSVTKKFIVNVYYATTDIIKLRYEVNKIVECDVFDKDIEIVCGGGIHYFKSLIVAYYFWKTVGNGRYIKWYDNGQKEVECNYINKYREGLWTLWHGNGQIYRQGNLKTGLTEGFWTEWHYNGKKSREGNYENGQKEGAWIQWHDNGKKRHEGKYKNDMKEGIWIGRHDNGKKKYEGKYENNKMNGVWKSWHKNDQLGKQGNFKNGQKEGAWIEWHDNGNKKREGNFENDKREGIWIEWHENGKKAAEERFKNGKKEVHSNNDGHNCETEITQHADEEKKSEYVNVLKNKEDEVDKNINRKNTKRKGLRSERQNVQKRMRLRSDDKK